MSNEVGLYQKLLPKTQNAYFPSTTVGYQTDCKIYCNSMAAGNGIYHKSCANNSLKLLSSSTVNNKNNVHNIDDNCASV